MHKLISLEQSAFVYGQQISDNILVAQEILQSMQVASKNNSLIVIKADIEWAYDHINWSYLEAVLQHFRFHGCFIKWIMMCYHDPDFSILINGAPST